MGDRALQSIARVLQNSIKRPADLTARYGGEEFVLVFPQTNRNSALLVAERIRSSVSELEIPHLYSSTAEHITVSIGVATAHLTSTSQSAFLLDSADKNLYTAKQSCRNMVVATTVDP